MVKVVTRANAYYSDDVRVFSLRDTPTNKTMAEGSIVNLAHAGARLQYS